MTGDEGRRVGAGGIGGSAGEAGSEYRRGVAAYAVVCGLSGIPVLGFGVPPADAIPKVVSLETDDPVDDVVVKFESDWTAFVQAKRRVARGAVLRRAVEQWRTAGANAVLDPARHRLVLVSGSVSSPVKVLGQVLERHKRAVSGSLTPTEQELLDELVGYLRPLNDEQIGVVLRCAVVHELDVETVERSGSREAVVALDRIVSRDSDIGPATTWDLLRGHVGRVAAQRSGDDLDGWVGFLRGAGVVIAQESGTPAAKAARVSEVLERYRRRMIREGETLDLRWLGAEVPALNLKVADADIKVHCEGDEERRDDRDLLWAFLRRGRAILTGLPGAGKSTSVRRLAADLSLMTVAPLPVRVSLRDVDNRDRSRSFRDRLVEAAIAEDRPNDRAVLREEIDHRLDEGGVALLLDSLDETYDRRGAVVGEIERTLASISADTDVLLVTRDIGYGHAATLGWPTLTQASPKNLDRVVAAVVEAARQRPVSSVSGRRSAGRPPQCGSGNAEPTVRWVRMAVAHHQALQETPLMPVILALQATERPQDRLPESRAATLVGLVKDVLGRYELSRSPGTPLGALRDTQLREGLMHAFAAEAMAILDQRGQADQEYTIGRIAAEVRPYWELSPGDAVVVARDAIRFLDESGLFVMAGPSGEITPRLALFAEIGAAWHVTHAQGVDLDAWAAECVARGQVEALVLAALLDADAALAFGARAGASTDPAVFGAAVRAYTEGAAFTDQQVDQLVERLIDQLAAGGTDGWDSLTDLLRLPLSEEKRDAVEEAAKAYDPGRAWTVGALFDLHARTPALNREDPSRLLDILNVVSLPSFERASRDQPERRGLGLSDLRRNDLLLEAQVGAAELLVGHDDAAVEPVQRLAGIDNGAHDPFRELLRAQGVPFTEPPKPEGMLESVSKWLTDFPRDTHLKMLDAIIAQSGDRAPAPAKLSLAQQFRLNELATFLETFGMNDGGNHHLFREPERVPVIIDLFVRLFGFDVDVLAAQAEIVRHRVTAEGRDFYAYYAAFDDAEMVSEEADWSTVDDVSEAMASLSYLQLSGRPHVWTAAHALWNCHTEPVHSAAVAMLEPQLERVRSSSDHLLAVTHTLLAVTEGHRAAGLAVHPYPSVREAAVKWLKLTPDRDLQPRHVELLADDDGRVREAALSRAAELAPAGLAQLLDEAASQTNPGWTCRHCNTVNPPKAGTSCTKADCHIVGPNPRNQARTLRSSLGTGTAAS